VHERLFLNYCSCAECAPTICCSIYGNRNSTCFYEKGAVFCWLLFFW